MKARPLGLYKHNAFAVQFRVVSQCLVFMLSKVLGGIVCSASALSTNQVRDKMHGCNAQVSHKIRGGYVCIFGRSKFDVGCFFNRVPRALISTALRLLLVSFQDFVKRGQFLKVLRPIG